MKYILRLRLQRVLTWYMYGFDSCIAWHAGRGVTGGVTGWMGTSDAATARCHHDVGHNNYGCNVVQPLAIL